MLGCGLIKDVFLDSLQVESTPNEHQMQTIFDSFTRTDSEPRSFDETLYQFLNRVADPAAEAARERINDMFYVFPEGEAKDRLLSELKSPKKDNAFGERLFELWVYHYLLSHGAKVLGIEVEMSNKKKVDYFVELNGQKVYVEVVTRRDNSSQHIEMDRLDMALRPLRTQSVSATIKVHEEGTQRLEPSDYSAIREQLVRSIADHAGAKTWDEMVICHEGVSPKANGKKVKRWVLQFSIQRRTKVPKFFIGTKFGRGREMQFDKRIHASLVEKADKYGELEYPLIVVCNVYGPAFKPLEYIVAAAFGGERYRDINIASFLKNVPKAKEVLEAHSVQGHGVFQSASCTKNLHSIIAFENENGMVESPVWVHLLNPKYEGPEILLAETEPTIYARETELVGIRGTPVLDEAGVGGYFKPR